MPVAVKVLFYSARVASRRNRNVCDKRRARRQWKTATRVILSLAKTSYQRKALSRAGEKIEPLNSCELKEGGPKYHVPPFKAMAAMSSDGAIITCL